jgi:predicted nucleic acid-binding protein
MILVDCDVASTFAKIDRIDLLRKTFPGADIYITNSIYIELTKSKDEGLSFPERVFESIPVITMERAISWCFRSYHMSALFTLARQKD